MKMDRALHVEMQGVLHSLNKQIDDYVESFFGSREQAEKYAYLYMLEEKTVTFESRVDDENNFIYRVEKQYRLRSKTPEELEAFKKEHPEKFPVVV